MIATYTSENIIYTRQYSKFSVSLTHTHTHTYYIFKYVIMSRTLLK